MSHLSFVLTTLLCVAPLAHSRQVQPLAHSLPGNSEVPEAVQWHNSYDEALAASRVSQKPVMLFQLLGRLDDALC